ncbi:MAG: hypothetical protein ACXVXC_10760 [Nocardioidaceae bacterium]
MLVRDLLAAYADTPDVRRVAVVGNAPLDPDPARAQAVDAADLVLRCNSFVVDEPGAAPTQGRKVHAVVFSRGLLATTYSFARYRDLAYLVTEPSRIYADRPLARYVKDWPGWWPEDLGFVAVPNAAFTVPLLEELDVPWRSEVVVPTTGTMAVFLARRCFPEADLLMTGFSMIDQPHQSTWQHQWGDTSPIGGAHQIAPEGQMFRRWIDEGKVRYLR